MKALLFIAWLFVALFFVFNGSKAVARDRCYRPTDGLFTVYWTTNGQNSCARPYPLNPAYCPAP